MRAIILAAGRGSRMKDATSDRPKCLVEVGGRCLIDIQIRSLREGGATEIGIVTGYRREALAGRADAEFHNPRWAETNMVESLACAEDWLRSAPCLVSYSDIFYTAGPVRGLCAARAPIAIAYDTNWLDLWRRRFADPLDDAETFRVCEQGLLLEIGNKPRDVADIGGQYMGLLRFLPEGWEAARRSREALPAPARDRLQATRLLQLVIEAEGCEIQAVPQSDPWGEIDSESDLALHAPARAQGAVGEASRLVTKRRSP